MSWLKDVVVDIAATVLVVAAVLTSNSVLSAVLWGYTALLLFVKVMVLFGDSFLSIVKKSKNEAPVWFTHLLYFVNTGILLYFHWWYVGAGWAGIWLFSFLAQRKMEKQTA